MHNTMVKIGLFNPCRNTVVRRMGSYYLFPEIPDSDAATNPLVAADEIPAFSKLTEDNCSEALLKRSLEYELDVGQYADTLKGTTTFMSDRNFTFDDAIAPLEQREVPFLHCWSTVKNLHTTRRDLVSRATFIEGSNAVMRSFGAKYRNPFINRVFQELKSGFLPKDDEQTRIVDKYLLEYRLNGLLLSGKEHKMFQSYSAKLQEDQLEFINRLLRYDHAYKYEITDYGSVRDLPPNTLTSMASDASAPDRGPWLVTFDPHIYNQFLSYCPNSEHRFNVWLAYRMRCSNYERDSSNSLLCGSIQVTKNDMAKLLGFDTFMDQQMTNTMAGKVSSVQNMIATMLSAALPIQNAEITVLKEFAASQGESRPLDLCDIPYWRRRHRLYAFGDELESKSRHYFRFVDCFAFLCELAADMFGVEFCDDTDSTDRWHRDVRCFSVWENGQKQATLFVDPYCRSNKMYQPGAGWAFVSQHKSRICNTKPVCYLNFNFNAGDSSEPAGLLSLSEVQVMFSKFGRCLMTLLCRTTYADVSAPNNIEWDAVDIPAYVLRYWLSNADNLHRLSRHHCDGSKLSVDVCQNLLDCDMHMIGHDVCQKLHLSQLDLKLHHGRDVFWLDIQRDVFKQFVPFKLHAQDSQITGFIESLAAPTGGRVYSDVWARMVAADVWSIFEAASHSAAEMNTVGRKFRDTFLALGGSVHPSEVFRRFCNRDPAADAFIAIYRLRK